MSMAAPTAIENPGAEQAWRWLQPVAQASSLQEVLSGLRWLMPLLDTLPDTVFFLKDHEGRYLAVNKTLTDRLGVKDRSALLGRRSGEVFPDEFGHQYEAQDERVASDGETVWEQLELHLYPNRQAGWCLTHKLPLRDATGRVEGLVGISRDLQSTPNRHPMHQRLASAAEHLRKHHTQALNVSHLADMVGLSVAQFERQFRKVYELSPRQMHTQARIQAATQWLAQPLSVAQVAQHCGYTDHSAFARQFRATVGMTPSQYRELQRRGRMAMRAAARDAQLRQQAQAPQRPLPAQAATPANPLHNPSGTGYWAD
jgi:AraC-like DNA-binding protein